MPETSEANEAPALKDGESAHPIPGAWRPTLKRIVASLVSGDYALTEGIAGVQPVKKDTATQIGRSISDYGCTLVELPDETWRTSVAQWYGTHWEFLVDLWTREEGRSDLVLTGRVTETRDGYVFDLHLVYVP